LDERLNRLADGELAPAYRAPDHLGGRLVVHPHDPLADVTELHGLDRGVDRHPDGDPARGVEEVAQQPGRQRQHVRLQCSGVGRQHRGRVFLQSVHEKFFLAGPTEIQRGLAHSGALGDGVHGEGGPARAGIGVHRRGEDPLFHRGIAGAAPRGFG